MYTNKTMTNDSQSKVGGHTKTKKRCHTDGYINKSILLVEFSVVHIILDGPHSSLFKSYVAFFEHNKVNILLDDWKDVPDEVKKSIWTSVQVLILIFIDLISRYINTNTYLLF